MSKSFSQLLAESSASTISSVTSSSKNAYIDEGGEGEGFIESKACVQSSRALFGNPNSCRTQFCGMQVYRGTCGWLRSHLQFVKRFFDSSSEGQLRCLIVNSVTLNTYPESRSTSLFRFRASPILGPPFASACHRDRAYACLVVPPP